jgi:multiple sugar transport system substrate-binding protein
MMWGWMISTPESSVNKELAWELLTVMLEPEVLAPMLHEYVNMDIYQSGNQ